MGTIIQGSMTLKGGMKHAVTPTLPNITWSAPDGATIGTITQTQIGLFQQSLTQSGQTESLVDIATYYVLIDGTHQFGTAEANNLVWNVQTPDLPYYYISELSTGSSGTTDGVVQFRIQPNHTYPSAMIEIIVSATYLGQSIGVRHFYFGISG